MINPKNPSTHSKYCLFTSAPIDTWGAFTHISRITERVLRFFADCPYHQYTHEAVWRSIMSKLHWAWCDCREVDTDLRSPDVWVHLQLYEEGFDCSILFKSDNNGTVNLIMDNSFDVHSKVKEIPHEFDAEWEEINCYEP